MNTVIWILQIVLAIVFAAAGVLKLFLTRDQVIAKLGEWARDFSAPLLKPLGLVEILAGAGLILPAATGIAPVLTALAAAGLVVIMLGAIAIHARRAEHRDTAVNVVLAAMAAVVAWSYFGGVS